MRREAEVTKRCLPRSLPLWGHVLAWVCFLTLTVVGATALGIFFTFEGGGDRLQMLLVAAGCVAVAWPLYAFWRRNWYRARDLARHLEAKGARIGTLRGRKVDAELGDLRVLARFDHPILDFWPTPQYPDIFRSMLRKSRVDLLWFAEPPTRPEREIRVRVKGDGPASEGASGHRHLDSAVRRALDASGAETPSREDFELTVRTEPYGLRITLFGGTWLGGAFGRRIDRALTFATKLVDELRGQVAAGTPDRWKVRIRSTGPRVTERRETPRASTAKRIAVRALASGVLAVTAAAPAAAQPVVDGAAFLAGSQGADGSWEASDVRRVQATTEALQALQAVGLEPTSRSAAADLLELEPVLDNDDRARRLSALAAAGRDVTDTVTQLLADRAPRGGWGLIAGFAADPLDTALALQALPVAVAPGDETLRRGLASLLSLRGDDGGFPCVDSGDGDADSEIFCTSHAVLALVQFRSTFFLDPEIDEAVAFLRAQLQPDGSFGPAGANRVIHTALAARALAAVPAFGSEVAGVISFLEGAQQADGGWQGDPWVTALALRALDALSTVPFCGDGAVNQPGEACDGFDLGGQTCEGVGLGAGTLACTAQCTLDTSGCSDPPVCGDDLRNQSFEVCDGTDLAAETCESLGFASGTLDCANDCLSFDVSGCNAEARCGDGVVNLPGELCDLSDLNGQTCESLGLGGGLLQCAPDCNLDTGLCDAAGFEIDNKGREFFVGFLRNFSSFSATAALHLTSDVATTVRIEHPVNNPSFVRTVDVTPAEVTVVNLPRSVHSSWSTGRVRNNAVRVSGPDEFVVYLVNRQFATSDAGMALPVDALGTKYFVTTARSSLIVFQDRSQFLVVAPFDDTTVTLTPTTSMGFLGTTAAPGVPVQVTLDRGQGLRTQATFARTDLTGTLIESNRPVAVVNGNVCTNVPSTVTFCDHIFEVAHPVRSWGETALVTNLPNRPAGSVYRVVASADGTEVRLDGTLQATLDAGELLETGPLTGNHLFAGSQPIFVTQFMTGDSSPGALNGDPAMANMIPPDQYLEEYTFSTVGGGQFGSHFLTVTAPDSSLGSVLLDGTPIDPGDFSPISPSGFSSAVVPLGEGSHTTSSPEPHGITVEGLNPFDSYIYPGGARLEFINQFCGDGEVNQTSEECDGSDFEGATCSTFGFSAGFLQCTVDCRVDTSQCSGLSAEDEDDDGFPATEDCDDRDPEINPGMEEIPGNGVDDDCNPATPDEIPEAAMSCELASAQIAYLATDIVTLEGVVENNDDGFTFTGLSASLAVRDTAGTEIFGETRDLAALPPEARRQLEFAFAAADNPPGSYGAELTVTAGLDTVAVCAAEFVLESSADTGAGLTGTLTLDPEEVNAGDPSDATYSVRNQGNASLEDLALRVILVDPVTGSVVAELLDTTSLDPGEGFNATQVFSTVGLETNKSFLAVLLATPGGTGVERTLDNATLTVVNAPPDCSEAVAEPASLWPPNHKLVEVGVVGVTDPDGDPITLTVTGVLQDERTDELGSGDTCPDATGVGTATASVRAERSGRQDGRVYHVFFEADDGRGGICEGEVTVCVPHDQKGRGATCVDQGAQFDSTMCE